MTTDTSWYGQQTLVHPDPAGHGYGQDHGGAYGHGYEQHGHAYGHQAYQQQSYAADPYAYGHAQPDHGQQAYAEQAYAAQTYAQHYDQQSYGQQDYGYQAHQQSSYAYAYPGHEQVPPQQRAYEQPVHLGEYYQTQPELNLEAAFLAPSAPEAHGTHGAHGGYRSVVAELADLPDYDSAADTDLTAYDAHDAYGASDGYEDEPADEVGSPVHRPAAPLAGSRSADRSRRRPARRRSAVLTIAVPSVAVLGVAGAAAATIGPLRPHHATTVSADASAQSKAQALAAAEAKDAAERASRDQQRTALALRNAAARKAAAEAPRFTLPIAYHSGLSALFGQAGTHWMQLHTGIDFPVPVGTPVHAVTGGTISTEWNPFYGYMVKLTAPDGTVTWYCHLSAYRVRSGQVKMGQIIAYSGDTGNSTGPHLHFEVHPAGGDAVDPLPWLLARGLDPR